MRSTHKSVLLRAVHIIVMGAMVLSPAAIAAKKGGGGAGGGNGGGGKGGGKGGKTHTYSGQATVVSANILGIQTTVSDTGPLPSSGGALEESLLNVGVPGLLTAEVAHATTIGEGDASRAEASLAALNLGVSGISIGATFVMSRASAACVSGAATVAGGSELVALQINGQSIQISGQPNQTINIPLVGKVIINEQISSVGGASGSMTVNALHVIVNGLLVDVADIVVSSAHADIVCANDPPCDGDDFITGGGWITGTPSGAKGNFGVAGGLKNGGYWGHLTFIDHGAAGVKVKGTGVTAYVVVNATTRHVEGTADIDGNSGTYQVDIADNGEPGSSDTFMLLLSSGYSASGTLGGGNIQLHKPGSCN